MHWGITIQLLRVNDMKLSLHCFFPHKIKKKAYSGFILSVVADC